MNIWAICIIAFFAIIILAVAVTFIISFNIFNSMTIRKNNDMWADNDYDHSDDELINIYKEADKFEKINRDKLKLVEIEKDGLRLNGEYYDFGYDRVVIIVPGKDETLRYSRYYAYPYKNIGFNVLVINQRCHGDSEGRYCTAGHKEHLDIIEWAKYVHTKLNNDTVVLHGISVGAASSLFVLTDKDCPCYVSSLVADGLYTSYYDVLKSHLLLKKKIVFPFALEIALLYKMIIGVDIVSKGPIKRIGELKKPILFIHSYMDEYARADQLDMLYDKCQSYKKVEWFESGAHGRLRAKDNEKYDNAVSNFYNDSSINVCFADF